jgi:hypothetical protein
MAITAQEVKNLIPDCTIDDTIVESIITDAGRLIDNLLVD